jgi:nucleoid-associated protein YgaU
MNCASDTRRGGVLKMLLVLLALAAVAAGLVYLIGTRGAQMQDGIRERGDRIRGKVLGSGEEEPAKPPASGESTPEPAKPPATGQVPKPPAPPAAKPRYTVEKPPPVAKARHTVAKGETLYLIAETYYEDGSLWPIIAQANGIKDETSELKEGMVIVIPGK